MKFRPTEFLNTPYRVSCYIKVYRKLFSCMRPGEGVCVGRGCLALQGIRVITQGGDLVPTMPRCVCQNVKDMGPFSASRE